MGFARLAALAAACLLAFPALAQKFPARPVTTIVPYPPGGSNDTFARALGRKLAEAWGQPVVIENKPGAGGSIGAALVNKAAPDGYTLMLLSSSFTTGAAINPGWPFDPVKGFTPLAMVARGPMVFTVANKLPAKTFAEFLALARAQPGRLNYGSSGQGSTNHFATELLMGAAGLRMTHVPYKGMGPATADTIAGHIDVLVASAPSIMQQVKAGKVRGLGVTSKGPSAVVPDLPALSAALPGYAFELWWGVFAPPAIPKDLAAALNAEINKAIGAPDFREILLREGTEPYVVTPDEAARTVAAEIEEWKKVAARAGIKAE
ncbi:MAG: tripartite tricarboxylate transporter substrate binding protein [Burkholderiales bacterium]|nr:tripartite tricarboxylate transporter substrate binding protein [Burkholderiales bacterium]